MMAPVAMLANLIHENREIRSNPILYQKNYAASCMPKIFTSYIKLMENWDKFLIFNNSMRINKSLPTTKMIHFQFREVCNLNNPQIGKRTLHDFKMMEQVCHEERMKSLAKMRLLIMMTHTDAFRIKMFPHSCSLDIFTRVPRYPIYDPILRRSILHYLSTESQKLYSCMPQWSKGDIETDTSVKDLTRYQKLIRYEYKEMPKEYQKATDMG
jgi:hypothetical protein